MRRWEELRPELEARGVKIVTVSTDSAKMIKKSRVLHGLDAVMLADPELELTDLFGLRNTGITVRPPGVPGLPVPTTYLVDAEGIVRWIDQSEHYVKRSDPERVRAALVRSLG